MANKVVPVPLPIVNAIVRYLGKCPYDDVADFIVVLGQLPTMDTGPQVVRPREVKTPPATGETKE